MKHPVFALCIVLYFVMLCSCGINPIEYDDSMLDGASVNDTSLVDMTFRVSSHPDVETFDRNRPVIICVHGYSACTYEWEEFREFAQADGRVYTSLVLLGAHGRDIEDFDGSTWEEWQKPIMEEYDLLLDLGFTRISFAGSSTGGTLLLEYLSRNAFNDKGQLPEEMFLIDPNIVPGNKLLHCITVVGPIVGNSPQDFTIDAQKRHWYTNRPASTLAELNEITELMRIKLEHGVSIPDGVNVTCYKSDNDEVVDPVSALLIYKGLSGDGSVDVQMVRSNLHVFTQLAARVSVSDAERSLQQRIFREMVERVVSK